MSETKPVACTAGCPRWNTWMVVVLLVIAFAMLFSYSTHRKPASGRAFPALELVPLAGGTPVTLGELRGKVVLLNFWATWCGPCQMELPELAAVAKHFAGNPDFRLLPVVCDNDNVATVRANTEGTLRRLGVDLPVYLDPNRVTREAIEEVGGLRGFPTTLLLDRDGVVRGDWRGYSSSAIEEMQKGAQRLLDEHKQ